MAKCCYEAASHRDPTQEITPGVEALRERQRESLGVRAARLLSELLAAQERMCTLESQQVPAAPAAPVEDAWVDSGQWTAAEWSAWTTRTGLWKSQPKAASPVPEIPALPSSAAALSSVQLKPAVEVSPVRLVTAAAPITGTHPDPIIERFIEQCVAGSLEPGKWTISAPDCFRILTPPGFVCWRRVLETHYKRSGHPHLQEFVFQHSSAAKVEAAHVCSLITSFL